ncbi:hypothetical protein PHMEG_0006381 [Phytophthora megakarya]|uniref:Uncharacterized protein n=1 Tax=Phytophthora megakarya TaxID=4795 RepID=A0A225WQU6_9STRA|nr:hypothetical protein PHMEG_0006381 [Phytophthora megakarya]
MHKHTHQKWSQKWTGARWCWAYQALKKVRRMLDKVLEATANETLCVKCFPSIYPYEKAMEVLPSHEA